MSFADTNPKPHDSDNVLLQKIAQSVAGGVGGSGSNGEVEVTNVVDVNVTNTEIDANIRKLTAVDDFVSVAGDVNHDDADSGAPVKIGFRANTSSGLPATVSNNDRVNAMADGFGRQIVKLGGKDTSTPLSSAARTTTTSGSVTTSAYAKGVSLFLNVSAVSGSASITLSVEAQNPVTGGFVTLATANAVATVSHSLFQIYPGIAETAGVTFNKILPTQWRVTVTHATADSITYSVVAILEP